MPSSLEDHPQRDKIERLILLGKSVREIANSVSPTVSASAVQRFRRIATAPIVRKQTQRIASQAIERVKNATECGDLATAQEAHRQVTVAAPFINRLRERQVRRERWMELAEKKDDFRALSSLDSNEGRDLELEARVSGVLDQSHVTINNNVLLRVSDHGELSAGRPEPTDRPTSPGHVVLDIDAQ